MKKKNNNNNKENITYGEAREELEKILKSLEEGKIEIEKLADTVERASELLKICKNKLESQVVKIKKIKEELSEETEEGEEEF